MTMDPSAGDDYATDDEESSVLYSETNSSPLKPPTFFGFQGYDSMFEDEVSVREL